MVKLILKLTGLVVVEALVLASAIVWALGGPTEAQAIVRLDGAEAVPLTPLGLRTCYAPGFTHAGFLAVKPGDSMETVRAKIGTPPIQVMWADRCRRHRSVRVRAAGRALCRVRDCRHVPIASGASMESLDVLRCAVCRTCDGMYSRQCTSLDSNRIRRRWSFDAGRVDQALRRRVLRLRLRHSAAAAVTISHRVLVAVAGMTRSDLVFLVRAGPRTPG